MPIFIIWIALSFLAGYIAEQKGRSGVGFFFLSLILSPLVGIIAALVVKPGEKAEPAGAGRVAAPTERTCPYCAESVKVEAIICKHCQRDLPKHAPEAAIDANALDALVSSGALHRTPPRS